MILFAALLLTGSAARVQAQCLTLEVRDIDRVQGSRLFLPGQFPEETPHGLPRGGEGQDRHRALRGLTQGDVCPGPFPRPERKRDAGHGPLRHSPGADGFQQRRAGRDGAALVRGMQLHAAGRHNLGSASPVMPDRGNFISTLWIHWFHTLDTMVPPSGYEGFTQWIQWFHPVDTKVPGFGKRWNHYISNNQYHTK